MKKFQRFFKFVFLLFVVSLLFSCMPRMTIKETAHYKLYEDIALTPLANMAVWSKAGIHIPKGAIVAVMAKGEIWDITDSNKWRWQPYQCLELKVGKGGTRTNIQGGLDLKNRSNLNVVPSGEGGELYLGMGTWWKNPYPQTKRGELIVRVIVWEKGHQDQIEADLLELVRTYPNDKQFRELVAQMASCLNQMGEYEKVQNLHKMMGKTPEIDWGSAYPPILFVISNVETSLGRNDRAKTYAEEALKGIKRYGNQYWESSIIRRLGMIASNLKQYEEANRYLEESLKISKSLEYPSYFVGASLYGIGQNLLRMNKPDEAVKHLKNALEYFDKSDMYFTRRWCYLSLGISYARLNKNIEAKKSFESAIEVAAKAADPEPQWRGNYGLARIAENEGDDQKTFEYYAKAISIIESMRAKFTDPSLKALFMKDKLRVYESMIQLLFKMQRTPEALHYLERAKARVMLDILSEKTLSSKNKEENELLNQEHTLRNQINELSMKQEGIALERPPEPKEKIPETRESEKPISEFERLQSQHRTILDKIEKLNSELASLVSINPLKAIEIQSLLDPDTALLAYFLGQEANFIFIATREKVLAVPLGVDSEKLFQKIREFRDRAVEGITLDRLFSKIYERPLLELYEILIQPIGKEIFGKKNLIIVPHGMLHYLPFQALLSREGRYLIESFNISYLPSATVLKYARAKNKGNRLDLFAVGNPVTDLSPLPSAEQEAQEVSALFDKRLLLIGKQATKASMKDQSPKYDLLHLSTHGEMNELNPLKSNLRFTPWEKDDGKLTVNEIFDMQIKANLVTLSACETALVKGEGGDFPQGDDLVGLSRAFIHAGAPSVIASLWMVSDESTVKLMRGFYHNLKSMSKSEALRKAQLDLMKSSIRLSVERSSGGSAQSTSHPQDIAIECSHPFFWAPFILLGDWR